MRRRSFIPSVILGGTAVAGLTVSHVLDYTLLIRGDAARQAVLHQTGHGYFQHFVAVAVAGGILAAITSMLVGYRRGRLGSGAPSRFTDWAWRLAAVQAGGFLLMEFGERLAAGAALHHFADPTIYAGVLIQLLVAALGAALLVLFDHAGEQVGRATSRPTLQRRPPRSWPRPATIALVPRRFARPGLVRAPPSVPA